METERSESWEAEMIGDLPYEGVKDSFGEIDYLDSESQSLENRDWILRLLKKKFIERNLEDLFSKYGLRLHRGYFSVFLLVQTSLCIAHISFLIFYAIDYSKPWVIPDILAYAGGGVLFWILAGVIFRKELIKKHSWIPHFASVLAIFYMNFVDTLLPLYHNASFHSRTVLRPAYTTHILLACHVFFPQDNNITPILLGTTTAVLHTAYLYLVTYRNSEIVGEVIFFVTLNLIGMYYRYINEIFIRRTFLDKRACVESTLKLNYEKEREEQLMLSILPRHLASRVREDLRKKLTSNQSGKRMLNNPYKELYIERHNDVSILYADVVNYTKMTSSLPIDQLLEILNELFGRFDDASEKHKVLRIKFLGDCYYCVSGVPQPNPDHAKSCVDLALDMINIIKEVREANDLNIDMRIGIHSGNIICGILGRCKWQYDIWSKDVIIANRMEQSGRSGMVHITKQTLDRLGPDYDVEPGFGHLRDELLAKCNIETFFVSPKTQTPVIPETGIQTSILWRIPAGGQEKYKKNYDDNAREMQKHGVDILYSLKRVISGSGHLILSRRRADFIDSSAITSQQQLKMADANMERDIENLPIGKFNQWLRNDKVHFLCLSFCGIKKWEKHFLRQPDPLFKYYIPSAVLIFLCLTLLQTSFGWSTLSYVTYSISSLFLASLLPLTWTHFIWNEFHTSDSDAIPQPKNVVLRFFHGISLKVIWSVRMRISFYIAICFLLTLCLLTEVLQIYIQSSDSEEVESADSGQNVESIAPWQITEGCSLVILMSFVFFRIHFILKLLISSVIAAVYAYFVCDLKFIFQEGGTWNPDMPALTAHILSVTFLVLELHLIDRQREFMSRLDFYWKNQMFKEKDEVSSTKSINKILLQNILPIHVAEIYLDANWSPNELYHENYDCVSVMFASLTNYSLYDETDVDAEATECHSLHILNLIICNFDDALLTKEFKRIEKIKVAGWTYMAACGLTPGWRDSNDVKVKSDTHVILIIARFAAEMMNILQRINQEYSTNFGLRVGISHGPVTAGVVGSHKPYYDIWGNTVNVASRMDSTGESGKIQVPEATAEVLKLQGVACTLRGSIFVKGKGNMITYFAHPMDTSCPEESETRI
ncbi:UNVERIFIED_CONTAM: hypothetical protein PYX00_001555 [Menopon gallinae]|uniref:adenylate cyclase n=1 Tax=Menopon gallinae TaxID=328185 RepID=A0AAW2IEF0_9NEOP